MLIGQFNKRMHKKYINKADFRVKSSVLSRARSKGKWCFRNVGRCELTVFTSQKSVE